MFGEGNQQDLLIGIVCRVFKNVLIWYLWKIIILLEAGDNGTQTDINTGLPLLRS
jgi:hypothetical protein